MIEGVASLLYVIGLNAVIAVALFLLYTIIHMQHAQSQKIYFPRLQLNEKEGGCADATGVHKLHSLSRSVIAPIVRLSDEDVLQFAGQDAYIYVQILKLCVKILLPFVAFAPVVIAVFATASHDAAFLNNERSSSRTDPNNALERFVTIGYIDETSSAIWISVIVAYCLSASIVAHVYYRWQQLASDRVQHLCSSSSSTFTVVIRDLPPGKAAPADCSTYVTAVASEVVKDTIGSVLPLPASSTQQQTEASSLTPNELHATVASMYSEPECLALPAVSGLCDAIDKRNAAAQRVRAHSGELDSQTRELEGEAKTASLAESAGDSPTLLGANSSTETMESAALIAARRALDRANEQVEIERAKLHNAPIVSAFVTFSSRVDAATAAQVVQHVDVTLLNTSIAPEPSEVLYKNLELNWRRRAVRTYIASAIVMAIMFAFAPFLLFVSGLANVDHLSAVVPALQTNRAASSFINAFLPGLVSGLLVSQMPPIFRHLARYQGSISQSEVEGLAIRRQALLLQATIWLGVSVLASVLRSLASFIEGKPDVAQVLATIGSTLPYSQLFFISFICAKIGVDMMLSHSRILGVLLKAIKGWLRIEKHSEWAVPAVNYAGPMPQALLMCSLGIAYAPIAPLVTVFALAYFLVAIPLARYQLVFLSKRTHSEAPSIAFSLFPQFAARLFFALGLSQLMLVAVLGLKGSQNGAPAVVTALLLPVTYGAFRFMEWRFGLSAMPRDVAAALDAKEGVLNKQQRVQEVSKWTPPGYTTSMHQQQQQHQVEHAKSSEDRV